MRSIRNLQTSDYQIRSAPEALQSPFLTFAAAIVQKHLPDTGAAGNTRRELDGILKDRRDG